MIVLVMSSAVYLTATQAALNAPRAAFSNCLKAAYSKAEAEKVAIDAYDAYVRAACSAEAASLKGALVKFDVKNGVKRSQANADADAQIDDYVLGSTENYQVRMEALIPKKVVATAPAPATPAPATAPVAVPASVPKEPQ